MYKKKFQQVLPLFVFIVLLVSTLPACQAKPPEPVKVTIHLNYLPDPEFAGFYVAEANGYFAEENVTVAFRHNEKDVTPRDTLINGEVEFAMFGGSDFEIVANESDVKVVALMATFQTSPLMVLTNGGITKPQDLEGKKVASKGKFWDGQISSAMENTGADPSKVIWEPAKYDEMQRFYDGELDAWPGFITSEPVDAKLAGHEFDIIYLGDYGSAQYEGILVTTQNMIDKNPDVVARVMHAVSKGWQYTIEHPEEASKLVAQFVTERSANYNKAAIEYMIPLISTQGGTPFGWIDGERWKAERSGIYDPANPGFTMQYLESKK